MATLTLRAMTDADLDAVTELWHAGWRAGHLRIVPDALLAQRDRASFRTRLELSLSDCFLAEADGALAGFIRLKGRELDQFYVAPDLIGTGVAGQLIGLAEDALRARGVREAYLIASVGNDRAIRFYEKQGWRNCGVETARVETLDAPVSLRVVRFEKRLT